MKTLSLLAAAAVLAGAVGMARAQETPAPVEPAAPESAPAPGTAPAAVPASLFPEGAPATRLAPPLPARRGNRKGRAGGGRRGSQYATDAAVSQANADPLEVRIAYRKAKTRALLDPALADLPRQADSAPTDEERRALLKEYYTRLYAAVRKMDKSPAMKAHVDLLGQASQQRYDPKRRAVSGEDDLAGGGRNQR